MSRKWATTDTKVPEDEAYESGILSGPISEQLDSGPLIDKEKKTSPSESKKTEVDSETLVEVYDSGIVSGCIEDDVQSESDVCQSEVLVKVVDDNSGITKQMANVKINEPEPPQIIISPENIHLLFEPDTEDETVVHRVAIDGSEHYMKWVISICPDKYLLSARNICGQSPLHLATLLGHVRLVKMLLLEGVPLGLRDNAGQTPLHVAVTKGDVKCLEALLNPDGKKRPVPQAVLSQRDYNGQACVHLAAKQGDVDSLDLLVKYKADINAIEHLGGSTPFHIAASRGDIRVLQYLIKCSAAKASATDYAGRTPRRIAKRTGTAIASIFASMADDSDETETDDDDSDDMEDDSFFMSLCANMKTSIKIS